MGAGNQTLAFTMQFFQRRIGLYSWWYLKYPDNSTRVDANMHPLPVNNTQVLFQQQFSKQNPIGNQSFCSLAYIGNQFSRKQNKSTQKSIPRLHAFLFFP